MAQHSPVINIEDINKLKNINPINITQYADSKESEKYIKVMQELKEKHNQNQTIINNLIQDQKNLYKDMTKTIVNLKKINEND